MREVNSASSRTRKTWTGEITMCLFLRGENINLLQIGDTFFQRPESHSFIRCCLT